MKQSTVVVIFCVLSVLLFLWIGENVGSDNPDPSLPSCLYDPRTDQPVVTPCAEYETD